MPKTAMLRVDAEGVVVASNDVADALLGETIGQRCCDVVVAAVGDTPHCRENCVAARLRAGGSTWAEYATVRDETTSLTCSSVGDEVIVAVHRVAKRQPKTPLTPREREVMVLGAEGRTNDRIAKRLGISASTVRSHIERILDKLGVRSRAEAVTEAIATGQLLTP